MQKRLLKAMPHVPILEMRPELREQNEATDDPDDPHDAVDDTEVNTQATDEANTAEMETDTTFHNLETECAGRNNGLVERVKRFISKRKANRGNRAVDRIELVMNENDNMGYGDDADDPQDAVDETELNTQGADEANAAEIEANTTFNNLEAEHPGAKYGLAQRVKRFMSKRKIDRRNIAVDRTELVMTGDDNMRYGDDEINESDIELEHM